jgi:hypothetical protein
MGWLPIAATALGILSMMLTATNGTSLLPWSDKARVVESIVPLAIALQAALLLSPDDEPALEVLLACQRPMTWVLLERLAAVFIAQSGLALVGVALSLLISDQQDIAAALIRWLPPAIFLSAVGIYTTLRSRVAAFGVVVTGITWFAFIFFGIFFLPEQPVFRPLNYLQPFLWPFSPYLQPGDLTLGDYWLNRLCVSAAGIALLMLAAYQLRDEEQVLLGVCSLKKQKGDV